MTDRTMTEEVGDGVEVEAKPKSGGFNGRKLVLFIILPLLLLVMGAAGAYFSGLADSLLGGGEDAAAMEEHVEEASGPSAFFELPEMLVNLNSAGRKANYLKVSLSLEVATAEDVAHLQSVLPRIIDNCQVYLRELRIEDLRGSAGLQRLREELLMRINAAAEPVAVKDVLFREMLVQ
ncbi:MAG: flagellar basal body-associated FliL family protein [Kiloniellales bacterium]